MRFPEACMEVLPRVYSDHNPLLLRMSGFPQAHGPKPFRFEAAWVYHEDYHHVVHQAWNKGVNGVVDGLNRVKDASIIFNKEVFGNIFRRKRLLAARIAGVQRQLENFDSCSLVRLERSLQVQYNQVLRQEEMLWFQKSRENWVRFGDRNTSFFHTKTMIQRRRNKIDGINISGDVWCTNGDILMHEARNFFKNLFCPNRTRMRDIGAIPQGQSLSSEAQRRLTASVSKEEVWEALKFMKAFKAPSPDGFQPFFFKKHWNLIGDDIWRLIKNAFETGLFDERLLETLIVLTPKIEVPTLFSHFRPISLCNVVYKLISKVLVNRLRPFIMDLVGPLQNSFIPGRSTTDNVIIAQEILHHMHSSKKKKGTMAIKVDLHKAYDSVDWGFLEQVLVSFGFPDRIRRLIMFCVSTSSLSLVWNGVRLPSFQPNRGLRQGDPISPYLFVLCMEKLSAMILEKVELGLWKPVRISRDGLGISHLLFADDLLLFTEAKMSQINLVMQVLKEFEDLSGLAVNLDKSKAMVSKMVPRQKRLRLAAASSISFAGYLGNYLGFPLIQGRMKKADFQFLLDKMRSRLSGWKGNLLNKAGRLTLAKAVLSTMPVYNMQSVWLPMSTCDDIDKLIRNFIWNKGNNRGFNLVNWKTVTQAKSHGGLGVREARITNIAMLGKLVAEFVDNYPKL